MNPADELSRRVDNPPLTLTQKIILAALAGALVGVVSALVWHNGTRLFNNVNGGTAPGVRSLKK